MTVGMSQMQLRSELQRTTQRRRVLQKLARLRKAIAEQVRGSVKRRTRSTGLEAGRGIRKVAMPSLVAT